jgi:hypothetical protein
LTFRSACRRCRWEMISDYGHKLLRWAPINWVSYMPQQRTLKSYALSFRPSGKVAGGRMAPPTSSFWLFSRRPVSDGCNFIDCISL